MTKYQDQDTNKIPVDPADFRLIAFDGWEGFDIVDTQEGSSYKDSAPTTTVLKRLSDDTYWAFNWEQYTSHYGSGDHCFYNPYLYKVERREEVITRTIVHWTEVK
jgi:hypothetical protein